MQVQNVYLERRKRLAIQLPLDAIALIPANALSFRNNDVHYRFRQDSDYYYLTGNDEPDGLLCITGGPSSESILFNQARDPKTELWSGKLLGQEAACNQLGVDFAYPLTSVATQLPALLENKKTIYYPLGRYPLWDQCIYNAWNHVKGQMRHGIVAAETLCDLAPVLSEMRLIKSQQELEHMRRAAQISIAAHERAMRACKNARFEFELEAEILYEMTRNGCRTVAYDSIVAAGSNACTLHYTANDAPLCPGSLVLIDAGGEFHNYAADITRTFPINGKFSSEQKQIYQLVLDAQRAGMSHIKKGTPWDAIQQTIVEVITEGLLNLGLLRGNLRDLIEAQAYKPFYMHSSGHWLGLDVHDVGSYKIDGQWRMLEEGMVLTVEPGIYIPHGMENVDARWQGIGVRIEDDVCVTADGYENFTAALAVTIEDIEAIVRD